MSYSLPDGVPRLIHQTWRDYNLPSNVGDPESWKKHNPHWSYRLWSDDDLLELMKADFPQFLDIFKNYPKGVQRADLGRYCILKKYGGVYADIDTICHRSLDFFAGDQRVIFCEEPEINHSIAKLRGLNALYFNGTMASPAGHPFWDSLLQLCFVMAPVSHVDVLESTGPLLLSAAIEQWPNKEQLALNSSRLFACRNISPDQAPNQNAGPFGHMTVSTHLWRGSWFEERKETNLRKARGYLAEVRQRLFGRPQLKFQSVRQNIDEILLHREIPNGTEPKITILIPVLNAEAFLEQNLSQILALDYPKKCLRIVYGQANSTDRTSEIIDGFISRYGDEFASIDSIKLSRNAPTLHRNKRWKAKFQYDRRAGLAKARNDLLKAALSVEADWILWLDVDVIKFPPDILQKLLAVKAKIVTPNCVLTAGGSSYDLNAFLEIGQPFAIHYFQYLKNGLFQPPADFWFRRHLGDLRYLNRVPLHGVGGTMLLVQADVHRSGLNFPELPYKDVLETEAFGYLARDLGVVPIGLPQVEIFHTKS